MGWPFREAKVRGPLRWTFSKFETALTGSTEIGPITTSSTRRVRSTYRD